MDTCWCPTEKLKQSFCLHSGSNPSTSLQCCCLSPERTARPFDVDLIGERAFHQQSQRANVEGMRFTFLAAGVLLDVSGHGKAVRTLGSPWSRHETELTWSRS